METERLLNLLTAMGRIVIYASSPRTKKKCLLAELIGHILVLFIIRLTKILYNSNLSIIRWLAAIIFLSIYTKLFRK